MIACCKVRGNSVCFAFAIVKALSHGSAGESSILSPFFLQEGYKVTPTKATRDGGYDLLAVRESSLVSERVLVECKCQHAPVRIEVARQLVGVVDAAKAARGVLVTSSTFTRPSIDYAKASGRLELLDHVGLCKRLNGHFGPNWITACL